LTPEGRCTRAERRVHDDVVVVGWTRDDDADVDIGGRSTTRRECVANQNSM
jgi:hypothetical protein